MPNLQEVFDRIKESKREQKIIKDAYRDSLENNGEYVEIVEKIRVLKERKRSLEDDAKADLGSSAAKLDQLKLDILMDNEVLSDLAFNSLVKGERVEVIDEYENKYEPFINVKFKKIK